MSDCVVCKEGKIIKELTIKQYTKQCNNCGVKVELTNDDLLISNNDKNSKDTVIISIVKNGIHNNLNKTVTGNPCVKCKNTIYKNIILNDDFKGKTKDIFWVCVECENIEKLIK